MNAHTPFCPHCGYDLVHDAPIILNEFSMLGPVSPLTVNGESVKLTFSELQLCWALMKSFPTPVRTDVLLERIGSEATTNAIHVYVCRIRKKLKAMGAPNPIKCAATYGGCRAYTWVLG